MKNLHGQSTEMEKTYCNLKFESHTYNFVNLLDDFRLKELYCDATIACDGKTYPVHQVVLSACSDFFANIFASGSCQNPLVVLQDVSSSHLESLLTYMYKGEVQVPQCDLPEFLKAAKSLFLKGLMIPHLEKYLNSEKISGTWHEPYYGPEDGMARLRAATPRTERVEFHGHSPHVPRVQLRGEVTDHPSYRTPMPINGIRVDEHFRRQSLIEHAQHTSHDRTPHKRPHYMVEFPQDLRVPYELSHEKRVCEDRENSHPVRSHATWEDEEAFRIAQATAFDAARDVFPRERKRLKSAETKEHFEEKVTAITNKYSSSDSHGTFQELIAADESPIKQEPEDVTTDSDSKLEIEDSQYDDDEEDEETPLHIAEDHEDMPEESRSDSRCNVFSDSNDGSKTSSQMSEVYSRSPEASGSPQGHLSPNSQLRRELLRPAPQAFGHLQQRPNGTPQSIPHPVIAVREPQPQPISQPTLREPPPLMKIPHKIPTLASDTENERTPPHSLVKDMHVNRRNSHLLVTAPPSYHPHNPPNHFCFEIHNQQLGPVLVNGGSHISLSSHSAFSPPRPQNNKNNNKFTYDTERPLNLSGGQRQSSKSPECPDNEDPFLGKIVTNRKKRLRGPKSWEFLVRLLKDPTTNPSLIRWENESNCIFRLVQPAIIAQRWGRRTGKHANENLSYENFARGLRYHYATGALKPVSEKSFVYRFGPRAIKLMEECDSTAFPYI